MSPLRKLHLLRMLMHARDGLAADDSDRRAAVAVEMGNLMRHKGAGVSDQNYRRIHDVLKRCGVKGLPDPG